MAEKPTSPFARLDTGLLRSTRPQPTPEPPAQPDQVTPSNSPATRPTRQARPRPAQVPRAATPPAPGAPLDDVIQHIRKIVRTQGKEVSFIRLTPEEKAQLADIVYTNKRRGRKTTENEIARIAVNYLLQDYQANGDTSMLARTLAALQA